ncbi:MAG: DUF4872 domain-containing protein [Anaerolineae bacterium]
MTIRGNLEPTSALMNVLAGQGVTAPHTGKPFTESMLLGISGGLGAGYILWEFKSEDTPSLVMGFSNRWNYSAPVLTTLVERMGGSVEVKETTGMKSAAQNLQNAKLPVLAWADRASLPYQHLPEWMLGCSVHCICVEKIEDDTIYVSDLAEAPFKVGASAFAKARNTVPSDKNRIMSVKMPPQIDLKAAITAGIADCIEHLGRDSDSFSLPVWKKWAKTLTSTKDKKGWQVLYKDRKGLFSALRYSYEGWRSIIQGAGLRETMYAEFLDDAAVILGNPKLNEAAAAYRHCADLWREFAEAALPDRHVELKATKELMCERYAAYNRNDLASLAKISAELEKQRQTYNTAWMLNDADTNTLLEDMSAKLTAVYEAEVKALDVLKAAMQ